MLNNIDFIVQFLFIMVERMLSYSKPLGTSDEIKKRRFLSQQGLTVINIVIIDR